jgi:serine/threonine protein kinase
MPAPPEKIGPYKILRKIGEGGMGAVYEGVHSLIERRVAIKILRPEYAIQPEFTARFFNEARAVNRVDHPGLVQISDYGQLPDSTTYIVMEFINGESLATRIKGRGGPLPLEQALNIGSQLADSLAAAHDKSVIHRDLKPDNVMIMSDSKAPGGERTKLLDFGIAKLKNARALRLTTAGAVMGSPLYMSPEQARGEDVDERADIWAACVVLYEAITGQLPFPGDDRPQVLRAVAELAPQPLAHHGVNDSSLWPIIARGLEKQRDDRWPAMDELGRALARWLLDSGVSDDITGASLEGGWFRTSRQSLFASSLPPERKPESRRWLAAGRRRAHQALLLAQALSGEGARKLQLLNRAWRWGLALGLVASVGLVLTLLRDGEPRTDVTAAPELVPPLEAPASTLVSQVPPTPPSDVAPAPANDVSAAVPESVPLATPPTPRPQNRAARKTPRASGAASPETHKEQRRSKLIDPYQ